jgi:hypothetical protein
MVCYVVPTIATVLEFLRQRKIKQNYKLNLMLLGGTMFGFIDHLWNGELLMISGSWMMDLALGFTITAGILGSWGITVSMPKITNFMNRLSNRIGFLK